MPPNKYLTWAVGGTMAVQIASNFIPPMRMILGATRLGLMDYAVVFAGAGVPFVINEAVKHMTATARKQRSLEEASDEGQSVRAIEAMKLN